MENRAVEVVREIERNKVVLAETDYKAIKFAEGEISEEEYAPIRELRRQCRAEINRLEAEYMELMNL